MDRHGIFNDATHPDGVLIIQAGPSEFRDDVSAFRRLLELLNRASSDDFSRLSFGRLPLIPLTIPKLPCISGVHNYSRGHADAPAQHEDGG
jgi:hypothetical protein